MLVQCARAHASTCSCAAIGGDPGQECRRSDSDSLYDVFALNVIHARMSFTLKANTSRSCKVQGIQGSMCDLYFVNTFYDVDLAVFDLDVIQPLMCIKRKRSI